MTGAERVLSRGGVVGTDLLRVDWEESALGPLATWPKSLVSVLQTLLTSRFAMWLAWGDELTFFCNDAYRTDTLATKYPWALGRSAREVWHEIWDDIGPRIESVLQTGEATWDESLMLFLERSGYREETYHTFSYSPIEDDDGTISGMLCVVAEETERVIGKRRMLTLRDLASGLAGARTEPEILASIEEVLADNPEDLPFTLTYHFDDAAPRARLVASTGTRPGAPAAPETITLDGPAPTWPVGRVRSEGDLIIDLTDGARAPPLPTGAWDRPPVRAMLLPLLTGPERIASGCLIVGLNPYRPLNEAMTGFVRLVAGQVSASLEGARSLEFERRRAEALAQLDRAKTQFFSNVSHEFRTPLTLISGPLAEAQRHARAERADDVAANLEIVERNALRLGKLVNSLLDFSRLQAGETRAAYAPVDLAAFTAELASMFGRAAESAGLSLVIDTPRQAEWVYVDPEMWEKIVFNLLSNALKFTFSGTITLSLRHEDGRAVLRVRDTGIGIPPAELPHLFERFHRVEQARGRSNEGSGIGLALVAELVALHGGEISVESELDTGSTFAVRVPLGAAHLPASQLRLAPPEELGDPDADAFLTETMMWDVGERPAHGAAVPAGQGPNRDGRSDVLVVDDNADMRAYMTRLLAATYRVRSAATGAQALEAIAAWPPDLVLSDVMMPDVDGVELVRRIRSQPGLEDLPVILVTAQAGPEATAEGLDVGADDYLVKPFAADDLLSRVSARIAAGLERRHRHAIAELGARLADSTTLDAVLQMVHTFAQSILAADVATLAVLEPDGHLVRLRHFPGYGGGIDLRFQTGLITSPQPVFVAIRTGAPIILEGIEAVAAEYPGSVPGWHEAGISALIVAPLVDAAGAPFGSFAAAWKASRRFSVADISLLRSMATAAGAAIERIRIADREHRILQEFQARLLEIDYRSTTGVVAARYRPAEDALLVGGDWYDVLTLPDGALGMSVGDVVGKGIPAAAVMGQLRSALGAAATSAVSPAAAMEALDSYALRVSGAMCATALYLLVEADGTLHWSAAGHPPPLVVHAGAAGYLEDGRRGLLGVAARGSADAARRTEDQARLQLAPGDLVLTYTDGLIERRGEDLDTGLERLRTTLAALQHLPVGALSDELLRAISPPGGFSDDVAVLAFRMAGETDTNFVDAYHAIPGELRSARRRLRAWLQRAGELAANDVDDVLLAVGEASSNALEHGSRSDPDRVVGIEVAIWDGTLVAEVSDTGSWQHDAARSAQLGRGRGLMIMHGIMDDVRIGNNQAGTRLTMIRHLRRHAASEPH
jgi:signal transduction histidine kinase/CheY-like chemotaxis protein